MNISNGIYLGLGVLAGIIISAVYLSDTPMAVETVSTEQAKQYRENYNLHFGISERGYDLTASELASMSTVLGLGSDIVSHAPNLRVYYGLVNPAAVDYEYVSLVYDVDNLGVGSAAIDLSSNSASYISGVWIARDVDPCPPMCD